MVLSKTLKIVTPPGKNLTLADVVGADEVAHGFLEVAPQVVGVKMDIEFTPPAVTSRWI